MRLDELTNKPSRSLCGCRPLVNTQEFGEWIASQGFKTALPDGDFHVTVAFSKDSVAWDEDTPLKNTIRVKGGTRKIERFGSNTIVLSFSSDDLHDRWAELVDDLECSWDFPSYKPHVSITYKGQHIDISKITPYTGELVFGPEQFRDLDEDYKSGEEVQITESLQLGVGLDAESAYEIFRTSYEKETGKSWTIDKFMQRARSWIFYGDDKGYVAVRRQSSGPLKLVGVAGDPRSIMKGLDELKNEGAAIWGAVSEPLARMAKKRGMIVLHTLPGGPTLMRALIATVPASVFGGTSVTVANDGGLEFDYKDVGPAKKYLIGNKAYFAHALKIPAVIDKIKELPGMAMLVKLLGLNQALTS